MSNQSCQQNQKGLMMNSSREQLPVRKYQPELTKLLSRHVLDIMTGQSGIP